MSKKVKAKKSKPLKEYTFTYRCEVKRQGSVEATSQKEALEKINKGDFLEEHEVDCYDIDDIYFDDLDEEDEDE